MSMRAHASLVGCVLVALLAVGSTTPAAAGSNYPVPYSFAAGIAAELTSPGSAPPGSNNWACRPSASHPYPVVLVHGTFGDMTDSWQALSPLLANNGYCAFALDYAGRRAVRSRRTDRSRTPRVSSPGSLFASCLPRAPGRSTSSAIRRAR